MRSSLNDISPYCGSNQRSERTSSSSQILASVRRADITCYKTEWIPKKRRYAVGIGSHEMGCGQNHCRFKVVAILWRVDAHLPVVVFHALQGALLDPSDASFPCHCPVF